MWPEQPKGAKGKNVIIIEPRPKNAINKILIWEVTLIKTHDGKETLKITIEASKLGGARELYLTCYSGTTHQTGCFNESDRSDTELTQKF